MALNLRRGCDSNAGQDEGGTLRFVPSSDADDAPTVTKRRRYDSPVRRQRAVETRDRIVAAGSELVHAFPTWDWSDLTFRAVAERAGVGERTVYRHFPSERQLHDAVMQRLEVEAGVTYEDVTLANVAAVAARVFASLHSFSVGEVAAQPDDPTFNAVDDRRRHALLRSLEDAAPRWSDTSREDAAAAIDVLWNLPSYERLVGAWGFDPERATAVVSWMIAVVVQAVDDDSPPRRPG
jgi:AcrR family transcriptional regulator